jgi:antitoxin VapB
MSKTARLFWNGRSQAVRLPKEFRFDGVEVRIRREGDRVVIEPLGAADWGDAFWEVFGAFEADFDLGDRSRQQDRELFGR